MPNRSKPSPRPTLNYQSSPPEIVDPRWILKALAATLLVAILCAYLAVCGLFYYGQWQLVLHPSRTVTRTPAELGMPFTPVRFGVDTTGQPQLDGWWIPGDTPADPTILLLHGADGSLSDTLPDVQALHEARLNVLAFDYRGFGRSGAAHPNQSQMQADSESALHFLTETRHIPAASIVVYGAGLGASLATGLCAAHHDLAALILNSPEGDLQARVRQDTRSRMVPLSLLFHENFSLAAPLHTLATPKLLITYTTGQPPPSLHQAADPKTTVEISSPTDRAALHTALRRFLDTYTPQPPPPLTLP